MRKALLGVLLLVLAVILLVQELERRWQQPLALPAEGLTLQIAPGASLRAVAKQLHGQGVLPFPKLLVIYGRWTGMDQQIKQGEYLLSNRLTAASLLDLLVSGKVIQYPVTLPEGITLWQVLDILRKQPNLEALLEGPEDERILKLAMPYDHPEGLFFPDTYHYTRGASDWKILQAARLKMSEVLEREWQAREPDLPYETPYEALIMASIIERETGLPEERRQIAGVFVRRLQKGMRLQTDPTVIYGIGAGFNGDLLRRDLADEANRYNTYRHHGLPPTPIALPGRASIHAALHPAEGSELFFVARGDGGHEFSTTLAEHQAAVRKFQLRRRTDYRSSPEKP